jgi:hypothetical protein
VSLVLGASLAVLTASVAVMVTCRAGSPLSATVQMNTASATETRAGPGWPQVPATLSP